MMKVICKYPIDNYNFNSHFYYSLKENAKLSSTYKEMNDTELTALWLYLKK